MTIPDDAEEVALQEADIVEQKALAQRQLVSDVSKVRAVSEPPTDCRSRKRCYAIQLIFIPD